MKVYIGYDPRDELAFRACVSSLVEHSSIPLEIIPLKDHELRRKGVYWRTYSVDRRGQRVDDRDGKPFSTDFSFTRFAIPLFDKTEDLVLFCDADFLFLRDIAELIAHADPSKPLMCVQHQYEPEEGEKFDGMKQERYFRKNWSSLMLLRPGLCPITSYMVNNQSGAYLHGMHWLAPSQIGALPPEWNWLEGWSSPDDVPAAVHYTRGTPDILGSSPSMPYEDIFWKAVKAWRPEMNRNGLYAEPN